MMMNDEKPVTRLHAKRRSNRPGLVGRLFWRKMARQMCRRNLQLVSLRQLEKRLLENPRTYLFSSSVTAKQTAAYIIEKPVFSSGINRFLLEKTTEAAAGERTNQSPSFTRQLFRSCAAAGGRIMIDAVAHGQCRSK